MTISKKNNRKKILNAFLILSVFSSIPQTASAGMFGRGGIKIPSASSIASELERRYNLDLGNLQNQSQYFNVSDNKKPTPEVTLYFTPNDPKPGQKITARAFTSYFANQPGTLYHTWYLKREGCDLTQGSGPASSRALALCDRDNDDEVTVEDWKIEAARIIATNGFDSSAADYSSDSDDDGYRAKFGGDNKANVPNHCYIHDPASGINYEIAKGSNADFVCPSGTKALCMVGEGEVTTGTNNAAGGNTYFDVTDTNVCYVAGLPACSEGAPICNVGEARCVEDATESTSCGTALSSCSADTEARAQPYCRHLFPKAPGRTSGDGSFGSAEERFWGTNSNDPDTAGNGNKDEANIVGLNRETFTWTYNANDEVGVAVEGTSLFATKHDDSSAMIMWAFSKNDCPISIADASGAYSKRIKGYLVSIKTADFDMNKCLERNLVNPLEGGQATNLEVAVASVPEAPVNDESGDGGGDALSAQASVGNSSQPLSNIVFNWKVEMSNNIQFNSTIGSTADVTEDLREFGLLGNTRGNALDTLRLKMDIPNRSGTTLAGRPLSRYLVSGVGYLRFTANASENFSNGITRRGQSDVIVKFTSTGRKITAYKAEPELVSGKMRVGIPGPSGIICQNEPLERTVCPVVKNEIIGLRVDPSGLDDFRWSVNGQPLSCTRENMSPDCGSGAQNEVNFIPIVGNTGDTYNVSATAVDVATGTTVNINRTFHVVEPEVFIEPLNRSATWPKLLGQYRDITGNATECPDGLCSDYSASIFETATGNDLAFRARFLPGFLGASASREWYLDNTLIEESAPGEIRFTADKKPLGVYNITLAAQSLQSSETRRALLDIWNISPLETPESNFSVASQVEVGDDSLASGPLEGSQKYFAAIASYIPATILFSFRILLSAILIIFVTAFLSLS